MSQFHQTQWATQNGAPSGIQNMVQSADGFIWLLAKGRLFRFDGVEFERIQQVGDSPLPAGRIHWLWARPAGGLWISYLFGGATFIGQDGTARNYSTSEGLPPNSVTCFAEDADGRMWACTTQGVLWLDGGHWKPADESWGLPPAFTYDIVLDPEGTLWLVSEDAVHFRRRGSRRFELALQSYGHALRAFVLRGHEGRLWLVRTASGLVELRAPEPGKAFSPDWQQPFSADSRDMAPGLVVDRESNLWVSNWGIVTRGPLYGGKQLTRGGPDAPAETTGQVRLPGDDSGQMLQDREGNIWAVSSGGLVRFRESAFVKVESERIAYGTAALVAAEDGSVWISDYAGGLHRFKDGLKLETVPSPHDPFAVLHRDQAGTLWVGGSSSSLYHRRGERWIEWRPEDAAGARGIQAIVTEADGTMWVSIARVGVYRVVDNDWTPWGGLASLPREPATAMAMDPAGRLWLGYVGSRIAVVDQGHVTVYDAGDGLSTGAVQVIATRGRRIWIGGENGVSRFRDGRFHRVHGDGGHTFGNVNGIIERADGELWFNTSDGAVLIHAREVRKVIADPAHPVGFRLFDHLDGMPGAPANIRPWPTAVESSDGRLWFATSNGVVTLAPRLPQHNAIVPNVYVKSITVDGQHTTVEGPRTSILRLPTRPHVLQIAYTAPSLTMPERVRFRYRLEGSDMGWEDVGTRREAYYTGLPPGDYRFQVIAANDSGVWNETGASLEFVIPPTFLQSRTFLVICLAAATSALWLLFMLRMRQVKAKLQWRNEARLLERERIARDLHDTFLQGIHGLMLRFQFATERIPEGEPARELMEDAMDRADRVLAEGREKVSDLRASTSLDLPEALAMAGDELAHDYAAAFRAQVEGDVRELDPLVHEEAYRIGAEALTNAFRHAGATRIGVTTVFGRRQLEVRVSDDGCGFDLSNVRKGRWGLKGMRERAGKIRGKIHLSSKPGAGTTVDLHIPARVAYRKAGDGHRGWRRMFGGLDGEHRK